MAELNNSKKIIKVLFVIDNYNLSGAEKVAINFIKKSKTESIVSVGVVCMDDIIGIDSSEVSLFHLNASSGSGGSLIERILKGINATRNCIKFAKEADIIIAVTPPAAIVCQIVCFLTRKPAVAWVHYDINGISREQLTKNGRMVRDCIQKILYHIYVPLFSNIIFVSHASFCSFKSLTIKSCSPKNWDVLPNIFEPFPFMDMEKSSTAKAIKALKQQNKPLLLFLGRIVRQKRWEHAIQTAELLTKIGFDFNMAFIGDGFEFEELQTSAYHSPACKNIHLLGSDKNPYPSLILADALIMTSLYEAWPTVILEAYYYGVLVFSYDCPSGPRDMLGDNERGFLIDENPSAMANAIINYFNDPQLDEMKSRILKKARSFLEDYYAENACSAWRKYFERLL
jgi:glycosyltransferase involved in cell wall biosynthesis